MDQNSREFDREQRFAGGEVRLQTVSKRETESPLRRGQDPDVLSVHTADAMTLVLWGTGWGREPPERPSG